VGFVAALGVKRDEWGRAWFSVAHEGQSHGYQGNSWKLVGLDDECVKRDSEAEEGPSTRMGTCGAWRKQGKEEPSEPASAGLNRRRTRGGSGDSKSIGMSPRKT